MVPLKPSVRLLILALAAVASFFAAEQLLQPTQAKPDQLVGLAPRPNKAATSSVTTTEATALPERDPSLAAPQRQHAIPDTAGEAFAPVSWLPPPPKAAPLPPAPPPPPPPAPTAPPLPFTFVGLLEQGLGVTQPKAFLAKGDLLLVVAAGDTLESNYSVDSITAQQITLTYLPLKTKQTLNVSGAPR